MGDPKNDLMNGKETKGHDEASRARTAAPVRPVADAETKGGTEVKARSRQYLITTRHGTSLNPMASTSATYDALSNMSDVKILKRIRPTGLTALSMSGFSNEVLVAETSAETGLLLQQSASPELIIEPNHYLMHMGALNFASAQPDLPPALGSGVAVQFKVLGDKGQPVPKAEVWLFGPGNPQQGITDAQGSVELNVFGGTVDNVAAVYVKPFSGFWERWMTHPALDSANENIVRVRPLESFAAAGFPGKGKPFVGWGQKAMGLQANEAPSMGGRGVRVAIIDSGCDNTHPALTHITHGYDLTDKEDAFLDELGHGTHCAGIIAGNGTSGIRGFVPNAEVHILKLFPGGQFDDLISALAYCVENHIDVVNCSLGSDQMSTAVQQRVEHARQAGVAVIVAAGNSSSAVQFPALLPGVLATSAVGEQGEFPPDTYHAQTVPPNPMLVVNPYFAAKFTCWGPQIGMCAPGVAIISSVPGGGYAAWDGTSMAAPHLTGLAALLLSQNPRINGAARNSARVDSLFALLRQTANDLGLPPTYEGAGLPGVNTSARLKPQFSWNPADLDQFEEMVLQRVIQQMNSGGMAPPAYPVARR